MKIQTRFAWAPTRVTTWNSLRPNAWIWLQEYYVGEELNGSGLRTTRIWCTRFTGIRWVPNRYRSCHLEAIVMVGLLVVVPGALLILVRALS